MNAANRWTMQRGRGVSSAPFLVAGIVNATPDSFSDGGSYAAPGEAFAHACRLVEQGADILDIGGESTRPGAAPVSPAEELARVMPVLRQAVALRDRGETRAFLVAVDTWRASTAAAVLDAGADIINDISGASFDPCMADVLAAYKPAYVLTHCPAPPKVMQNDPVYDDVTADLAAFFERQMNTLVRAGLPESNIVLDPGIGFGKTVQHNIDLLRSIDRLQSLGRPLYIGISRKGFLGSVLGLPLENRDGATAVLTALLAARGVMVHRVHDVAGAVAALRLVSMMQR